MIRRQSTYVLELEAADYFKLNLNEVKDMSPHISRQELERRQRVGLKYRPSIVAMDRKLNAAKPITRTKSTNTSGPPCDRKHIDARCRSRAVTCNQAKARVASQRSRQTQTELLLSMKSPMELAIPSPNASLQSLPSISSSASVSPSLVCPHLTLDDIINRQHSSTSPHTVGLCKKCRLEPPPNVQSPLSPVFKPHVGSHPSGLNGGASPAPAKDSFRPMLPQRRHSDQQVGHQQQGQRRRRLSCTRDESLDHWLEPEELRRLEMSPSLRDSVEFIRSNPRESGRILRIYKNGEPYEKPLRVCVMRGEFTSLAHLLDHINGRMLIPHGARYLFHLGGQQVYSENELKHNSIYIVSGVRSFNFRANAIIALEAERGRARAAATAGEPTTTTKPAPTRNSHRRSQVMRRSQSVGRAPTCSQAPKVERAVPLPLARSAPTSPRNNAGSTVPGRRVTAPRIEIGVNKRKPPVAERRKPVPVPVPAKVRMAVQQQPPPPAKRRSQVKEKSVVRGGQPEVRKREPQPESLSKSSENLEAPAEEPALKSKSIVRAKSELADATGRRKKNVTFVDMQSAQKSPVATRKAPSPAKKSPTTTTTNKATNKPKPVGPQEAKEEPKKDAKQQEETPAVDEEKKAEKKSMEEQIKEEEEEAEEPATAEWQYPGGREFNVTPEERPISQLEADEATSRAKVVTPSPSLSITNDSLRLSMSLDEQKEVGASHGEQPIAQGQKRPVIGKPCQGTNLPASNFELVWVNGVCLNERVEPTELPQSSQQQGLLSPVPASGATAASNQPQFKPTDRFHNWLCYSSRYEELVYPTGCLVVLWQVARDEQRYYSGHSLNVAALALCSNDRELAASAQAGATCVHLWSLGKLETVRVLEDSQFVDLRLFSVTLRNSEEDGCELAVAGYATNKRLKVVAFFLDLRTESQPVVQRRRGSLTAKAESVLKASKPLKASQLPLGLVLASSGRGQLPGGRANPLDDVLISLGQEHFQVWFMDRKQRDLKPIESKLSSGGQKLSELSDSLSCFANLGGGELLVGTAQGVINLIKLKCGPEPTSGGAKQTTARNCDLELMRLHQLESGSPVTALARVSRSSFVSVDASQEIRLWKLDRGQQQQQQPPKGGGATTVCLHLLDSLALPRELGFACSSVATCQAARLELILVSSRNVFIATTFLINEPRAGSLRVLYDGHESPVTGLVADRLALSSSASQADYFTCSLDCNICRWNGRSLVWKSMLPSACACLGVHPTGFVLAVGSTDGTVYILDKISGLLISYFPLTPVCINCLAYSRDGALLAAGCANGSIFILPVYERGLKYKKVSIFQSPHPVVSLQFSLDNKYILTSVTQAAYQELVLWDLPNFRYMCQNVRTTVDKIQWFDSICSASEDVRAIWENRNLTGPSSKSAAAAAAQSNRPVVNLSCHRLVTRQVQHQQQQQPGEPGAASSQGLVVACDAAGHLRLFQYPCYDSRQGFFEARVSSLPANCCRFLPPKNRAAGASASFVSTTLDGAIFLWSTC